MSRSYKKAIKKDKTNHKWYNRIFRRVNKQRINSNKEPKTMKELINPYNVCDWIYNAEVYEEDENELKLLRRK